MSVATPSFVVQHNGVAATSEHLIPLSFAGYAHFTAIQVRNGQIRGLDLHLSRLRQASLKLFGQALPDEQVIGYINTALATSFPDVSLIVTVYSPAGEFTVAGDDVVPEVLVRTMPASNGPAGPLKLALFDYERVLPAFKHVGEVAKTYYLRQAVELGFDDAAFVDRHGRISEGSIWNLAFWDGQAVVWPEAQMLIGTTMGIVRRQLAAMDIPQRTQVITQDDLPGMAGAVVMNSWTPGIAVHHIGAVMVPTTSAFVELLHRAYQAEPLISP